MLKKRIISVLAGLVLLAAVAGSIGVVVDTVGLSVTSHAYACAGGGLGGQCVSP